MFDPQLKEKKGRDLFEEDFGSKYTITYTQDIYNTTDFTCTATTNPTRTYVGEIKAYTDAKHPRRYDKFPNYQIDYIKLKSIERKANESNSIPILVVYFEDILAVWDLSRFDWKANTGWVKVNKYGYDYGREKENSYQAFISVKDARYVRER